MTPLEIMLDEQKHARILAKSAFRHGPGRVGVVLTPAQSRSLDAANRVAMNRDDIEMDSSSANTRTAARRLAAGLSMMESRWD